jgi:peptidoglycan-associated lipoprotein
MDNPKIVMNIIHVNLWKRIYVLGGPMKKLIVVSMIVGMIGAGCAQKAVVQGEAPVQKPAAVVEGKTVAAPTTTQAAQPGNINETELAEMQRLKKELQENMKDIHFNFDKYDLESDAKPALSDLAKILMKHPKLKVIIEGNCDERGTMEYNLALGDKRANAAKQYMISAGISSSRIETISYGKEKPICTQSTEECWTKNRRDHFVLN